MKWYLVNVPCSFEITVEAEDQDRAIEVAEEIFASKIGDGLNQVDEASAVLEQE